MEPKASYRCSFCSKTQNQVHRLIAGPGGVYVCDECIELHHEILEEEKSPRGERGGLTWEPGRAAPEVEWSPECVFCSKPVEESNFWTVVSSRCESFAVQEEYIWYCHEPCLREWKPPSLGEGFGDRVNLQDSSWEATSETGSIVSDECFFCRQPVGHLSVGSGLLQADSFEPAEEGPEVSHRSQTWLFHVECLRRWDAPATDSQ